MSEGGATRTRLAVVVPAYGRGETIAATLERMVGEAQAAGLDVAFYVSDDTPDASVEDAIRPVAGGAVHYRRNTPALQHDRNLVASLLWPDADHVWLLGSGLRTIPGQLARVYAFLQDQDLLLVNCASDDWRRIPARRGEDGRALLRDALWHQAMTGTTIYGRRVRDWMRQRGDALTVMRNFPQISVMAGFASDREPAIGWFGERSLEDAGDSVGSYWRARGIEVFVYDWAATVDAFPRVVPPADRTRVIREHSRRSKVFNTFRLVDYKRTGQLAKGSLRDRHYRQAMHEPLWKLLAVHALPHPVLVAGMAALKRLKAVAGRADDDA